MPTVRVASLRLLGLDILGFAAAAVESDCVVVVASPDA